MVREMGRLGGVLGNPAFEYSPEELQKPLRGPVLSVWTDIRMCPCSSDPSNSRIRLWYPACFTAVRSKTLQQGLHSCRVSSESPLQFLVTKCEKSLAIKGGQKLFAPALLNQAILERCGYALSVEIIDFSNGFEACDYPVMSLMRKWTANRLL